MTIFIYIMLAMVSALMLAGAVVTAFKIGEKELICKYGNIGEDEK